MLTFRPIQIEDQIWAKPLIAAKQWKACEYSFANIFIWSKAYQIEAAQLEDFYLLKTGGEQPSFLFPAGTGDLKGCIDQLSDYCKERGVSLRFHSMVEEAKAELEALYPGRFVYESNRDTFDYIYRSEDLISLAGKKYHGKRNHIRRFQDGDWSFEPMTEENIPACIQMNEIWCSQNDCLHDLSKQREACAVRSAFAHFTQLGLQGGVLRREGRVVAFSMGEPLTDDTYVVHIEKAFAEIQGAYPAINQEFAKYAATGYQYINREDDVGAEGLRKAKLSYYPAILLEKYTAQERENA